MDSSLVRDAAAFYDALSELIRIYQFRDRDRVCCHGISVTQCYALEAVARYFPITVNELAGRLFLDKSTVSRVINSLEKKELLCRLPHVKDGRAVELHLTRKGDDIYRRIRQDIEEQERRLLEDFDPDVRTAMIELIDRLARSAEKRVSTTGGTCCSLE